MNDKKTARLPWVLCVVVIVGALFSFVLDVRDNPSAVIDTLLNALYTIAFGVVGALILGRHARHTIGWLLMIMALSLAVLGTLQSYLGTTVSTPPEPTWTTLLYVWLNEWTWWSLFGPLFLILLLFPTGHLLSPRWRWVVVALAALFSSFLFFATFSSTWTEGLGDASLPGPFPLIPDSISDAAIGGPWIIALAITAASCVASVLVRYRHAGSVEREQLKWFLFACAVFLLAYVGITLVESNTESVLVAAAILLIPASIGIAILRYRLFDIDVIIRKTLVYTVLTALLGLVYFGGVALLQQVFRGLTGETVQVAIVASTLLIAALFAPLRRRIQDTIDRRFYRRKYDAQQVLAAFAETARDETDLGRLTEELVRVVEETMQPAHVSLWLKPATDRRPLLAEEHEQQPADERLG